MKQNILKFFKIYLLLILIFVIQKPLFMIFYHDLYMEASLADYISVMWHGMLLDASMAGYLTVLPGIFLIIGLWANKTVMNWVFKSYFIFLSLLLSIIFVGDLVLYRYWGFRLDSTPLFYLKTPKDAMASADGLTIALGLSAMILIGLSLYFLFYKVLIVEKIKERKTFRKIPVALLVLLLTALLFVPIRGGFSVSTMNVGKVYFSDRMELNHAAINPCFSLLQSLTMEQDFDKQFRFMDAAEAQKEFATLVDKPAADSIPALFTATHPNLVFVVLESFMSRIIEPLGGIPSVAVNMNKYCGEGILFTNFYANSFRTDRGLVSIFSGYPAQPTTSIMKYPHKSQSLPSIPKSLRKAGYDLQYYYGGDADFTNMRSYLTSMGIKKIISEWDFLLKDRYTKWGAPDHVVFNRLATDLEGEQKEPFMKIIQTLSSHEPYEIPSHKLKDPYLNSVAYTDSCLGVFVNRFKKTRFWKNTVIVLVPDHAMRYPATLDNRSVERHQIPLLMIGGAVKAPRIIDTYAAQMDIAATLLAQLNLPHADFEFSKNILNPASPHFGYFTFPNGFGMVTPENKYVFDCESNTVVVNEGQKDLNKKNGEALLQTLYDDLEKR